MPDPIRLLVVDVPTLSRGCLVAFLSRRRHMQVVGEAADGREARRLIQSLHPDVTVVDPVVPEGGLPLITELCRDAPGCAVLVLTLATEDRAVRSVIEAGARGYLSKHCTPDDLVRTVERLHAGELVVAAPLGERMAEDLLGKTPEEGALRGLTPREIEVLQLVAAGRTNAEIARALCITEHTAKGHLAKLLRKLGLENRVQLATYALQSGLRPPTQGDEASLEWAADSH